MAANAAEGERGQVNRASRTTALAAQLADRMANSLLPGEGGASREHMAEAAEFLFEAAAQRAEGEPAILIGTAHEQRRFMRIAVVNDDMPFLVNSIATAIAAQGLAIDLLVHPIVPVQRDGDGQADCIAGYRGRRRGTRIDDLSRDRAGRCEGTARSSNARSLLRWLMCAPRSPTGRRCAR